MVLITIVIPWNTILTIMGNWDSHDTKIHKVQNGSYPQWLQVLRPSQGLAAATRVAVNSAFWWLSYGSFRSQQLRSIFSMLFPYLQTENKKGTTKKGKKRKQTYIEYIPSRSSSLKSECSECMAIIVSTSHSTNAALAGRCMALHVADGVPKTIS